MLKALLTGINGFVGSHLAPYLEDQGFEVYGTVKPGSSHDGSRLFEVDILDYGGLKKVVEDVSPDYLVHLAALTSPADSFNNPAETISNNIIGQVNVLQALKELQLLNTRTLVVSSAEIYGKVDEKDLPIDENTPFCPPSPYAVSKVAQDMLGLQYFIGQNIQTIRVRPFNHIGPGQPPVTAVSSFSKQIAEIEKGKKEPVLSVGNLDTKRDFTDVRDIVKAYALLFEKGESGEVYNIGSGKSVRIGEVLERLLALSNKKIIVENDPELMRPADIKDAVCDNSRIKKLGWNPTIPMEKTLQDTLDYWRNIV